jgi:hypothetical protein
MPDTHRSPGALRRWTTFPATVDDHAARTVATIVIVLAVAALATSSWWIAPILAAGFALRVLFGPRVSPAALVATRLVAPRLHPPVIVPGPPKRFAQAIGLVVTGGATVAWLLGAHGVVAALLGVIIVAATLEAVFAFCLGCWAFAQLMRIGLVPRSVCERCVVATD